MTLELGKRGATGDRRAAPVLRDGEVVAVLALSRWREAATATVGDRDWVFRKHGRELTGRWAADPEDTARLSARQRGFWQRPWSVDLQGTILESRRISLWRDGLSFVDDAGRLRATSGTVGHWSPRPTLRDDGLPLEHGLFLLWLQLVVSGRDSAGAATTAGGGG